MNDAITRLNRFTPQALELVEANAAQEEAQIIQGVQSEFDEQGMLRPEFAVQQWIRLLEARKFLQRLRQQEKRRQGHQKSAVDAHIGSE